MENLIDISTVKRASYAGLSSFNFRGRDQEEVREKIQAFNKHFELPAIVEEPSAETEKE